MRATTVGSAPFAVRVRRDDPAPNASGPVVPSNSTRKRSTAPRPASAASRGRNRNRDCCPASVRPAAGRTELIAVSTSQTAAVRRKRSLRTGPSNRWNRPSPTPVGRHLAFGPGHAQPPGWGVSTSEERLPSERHPRMLSLKRLGATGESGEDACLAVGYLGAQPSSELTDSLL
jgi:hypothetical protein